MMEGKKDEECVEPLTINTVSASSQGWVWRKFNSTSLHLKLPDIRIFPSKIHNRSDIN